MFRMFCGVKNKRAGIRQTNSGSYNYKFPGDHLLSHTAARAVPSALKSLTSVFGMETGVASSLSTPGKLFC